MPSSKNYRIIVGEPARRKVKRESEVLRPVCLYRDGFFRLAMEDEANGAYISEGRVNETRLIAAYRGMKILEGIFEFQEVRNTLDHCLMAGRHDKDIEKGWADYVREIESRIGKEERSRILKLVPENLDGILGTLEDIRANYDRREILKEFQMKTVQYTPKVEEVLDKVVAEIVGKR